MTGEEDAMRTNYMMTVDDVMEELVNTFQMFLYADKVRTVPVYKILPVAFQRCVIRCLYRAQSHTRRPRAGGRCHLCRPSWCPS